MRVFRVLVPTLALACVVPATLIACAAPASAAPQPNANAVAKLAMANVDKKACSRNSLGGKAFESSCTGNGGKPEYWCADFARWVWANAGVADTGWLDAAAGSFYAYGLEFGTLSATPAVGDAVVFNYSGHGVAEHVALVTQANANGTIETMSGDWNGESGSETRFASTSSVVANTPAYPDDLGTAPAVMGMTISAYVAPVGVAVTPVLGQSSLPAGQLLSAGDSLNSPNGLYSLQMGGDGNLVEYVSGRPEWSTGTEGHDGGYAVLRSDGDLVVHSAGGGVVWSSRTGDHTGTFTLVLEDNGLLLISGSSGTLWSRRPLTSVLWQGKTLLAGQKLISTNGLYSLDMQGDGNLVEFTAGRALWSTGTEGNPGDHATLQPDGDLVVFAKSGSSLWSSDTPAHTGSVALDLQGSGELEIRGAAGTLWSDQL